MQKILDTLPSHMDVTHWLSSTIFHLSTELIAEIELQMVQEMHTYLPERGTKHKKLPIYVKPDHLEAHLISLFSKLQDNALQAAHETFSKQHTKLTLNMGLMQVKSHLFTHKTPTTHIPRSLPCIFSQKLIIKNLLPFMDNLIYLDIETDGLAKSSNILSITILKAFVKAPFSSEVIIEPLIQAYTKPSPDYTIDPHNPAIQVNKISQSQLDNSTTSLQDLAPKITELLEAHTTVGYNLNKFDIPILLTHLQALGFTPRCTKTLDLYQSSFQIFKNNLPSALKRLHCYKIPEDQIHTSNADAEACIRLLAAFQSHHNILASLQPSPYSSQSSSS